MGTKTVTKISPFGNDRATLLKLLNGNADVVVQLEQMVNAYRRTTPGTMAAAYRELRATNAADIKHLQEIAAAIRQARQRVLVVQRRIEAIPANSAARHSLDFALRIGMGSAELATINRMLEKLESAAEWSEQDIQWSGLRAGAPGNIDRQALENLTAEYLADARIPLRKSRDGVLAKVLQIVYEAAEEERPIDMFPVVTRLVEKVKESHSTGIPIRALG